ncbi:hypothetical protein DEU56DRAFT_905504 [Suillus clintonianus]|uniref:uncharacterized protein n=1 Tax=Suillus clintonianus TaxID=1904413 RepID=UPI001B8614B0|nr:uncharacterized protein DEU56DRAFT_905504 [Suillus clintonianus]KAG2111759.1 hypothetical protein DEU56DRAFT_905504 [Suillus clintonianus]
MRSNASTFNAGGHITLDISSILFTPSSSAFIEPPLGLRSAVIKYHDELRRSLLIAAVQEKQRRYVLEYETIDASTERSEHFNREDTDARRQTESILILEGQSVVFPSALASWTVYYRRLKIIDASTKLQIQSLVGQKFLAQVTNEHKPVIRQTDRWKFVRSSVYATITPIGCKATNAAGVKPYLIMSAGNRDNVGALSVMDL